MRSGAKSLRQGQHVDFDVLQEIVQLEDSAPHLQRFNMQQFQRSHIIQGHFYSAFSYGPNCSKRRILAGPQSTDIISFMSQKPLRSVFLVCLSFCTIPERHPVMKQIARKKAHAADMQEPRAVIKRSKSPSISLSHSFLSTLHKGVNSRQIIAKIHTAGLSRLRHSRLRLHLYQQLVLE